MKRSRAVFGAAVLGGVVALLVACGSGSSNSPTSTRDDSSPTPAISPTASPPTVLATVGPTAAANADATAVQAPSAAPAPAGNAAGASNEPPPAPVQAQQPPPPPPPSAPSAPAFNAGQAQALLASASLTPKDLPAGWTVMTDTTQDNAAAAASDPAHAASIQRCGRLLGRTVANQPPDVVAAYLGGHSVSFFSAIVVYSTVAGATDCAIESAQRFLQPGELARAFGPLFIDPNAVKVAPVSFPQVADGSFAATLTGKINAAGTVVDLTILVVGLRKGNVTVAVGSAASAAPSTSELKPYVDLVVQRIAAAQQVFE